MRFAKGGEAEVETGGHIHCCRPACSGSQDPGGGDGVNAGGLVSKAWSSPSLTSPHLEWERMGLGSAC